jgi:hypothetical protein
VQSLQESQVTLSFKPLTESKTPTRRPNRRPIIPTSEPSEVSYYYPYGQEESLEPFSTIQSSPPITGSPNRPTVRPSYSPVTHTPVAVNTVILRDGVSVNGQAPAGGYTYYHYKLTTDHTDLIIALTGIYIVIYK